MRLCVDERAHAARWQPNERGGLAYLNEHILRCRLEGCRATAPKGTPTQIAKLGGVCEPDCDLALNNTDKTTRILVRRNDQRAGYGIVPEQSLHEEILERLRAIPQPGTYSVEEGAAMVRQHKVHDMYRFRSRLNAQAERKFDRFLSRISASFNETILQADVHVCGLNV